MPYDFTLTAVIPASARQIYDAWLDSLAHSEMTGSTATMTTKIGANVSSWGGYITGRNLDLVPGERIVQSWRTSQFTDEHEDSIITVTLEKVSGGTLLTLVHANVPDGQTSYERGGWQDHYFKPMMNYFAPRKGTDRTGKAKAAASKSKRKPIAVKAKTKRKASKVKAAAVKKAPKRAAAKAKAKRAKKSAKSIRAKPKNAKRSKSKSKRA